LRNRQRIGLPLDLVESQSFRAGRRPREISVRGHGVGRADIRPRRRGEEAIVSFKFLRIESPNDAAETLFAEAIALLDRSEWRRPQRYFSWSHDIRMRLFVTAALVFSI